jgi:hypothetical protein
MEAGSLRWIGLLLLVVIIFGYVKFYLYISRKMKKESRAAHFQVGGTKFGEMMHGEESREERQQRHQVSLRDGPRLHRRMR